MTAKSPASAYVAAAAALILWSGTPVANRMAVAHIDGLTAGVLRSMVAGVIALGIARLARLKFPATPADRILLAVSGISSFAVWPAVMSIGLARTTASHGALIMATIPIFTVLIALSLERRLPKPGWWFGTGIAIAATAALITVRSAAPAGQATAEGDLIIACGGLVCAVGYVCGGRLAAKIGTIATTFWGLATALIVLVPTFALAAGRTNWPDVPLAGWLALAWMAFCSSLAGYGLWFYALGRGDVARIGSMQLASPVLTLLAASLILGEQLSWTLASICAAVIFGTYLAQRLAR